MKQVRHSKDAFIHYFIMILNITRSPDGSDDDTRGDRVTFLLAILLFFQVHMFWLRVCESPTHRVCTKNDRTVRNMLGENKGRPILRKQNVSNDTFFIQRST